MAAVGAAIIWPRPSQAEISGLPLPAPAGTVWSVESGYNTGSHGGVDPHALDIVRSDGPTAGTPVLAPVAGKVSVASSGCVAIEASARIAVLLCHLLPHRGVELGATVQRGQELGQVAPPGAAENHGLAHLHLAVHTTPGGGELRMTVPLTGRYALEGWELPDTKSVNAYVGMAFRSTNHFAALDPYYLYPGWNLVSWTGPTAIEDATASLGGDFGAVFTYDAVMQRYRGYAPDAPADGNSLTTLRYGDGLLVRATAPGRDDAVHRLQ